MADYKISITVTGHDKASGPLGQVGKALGGLGAVAGGAATAVVGALGGIGVAIARFTIDAAPLQLIQEAFESLTAASGVASGEMLKALQESSAGMITQRDLMTSYNLAAQLVGTDFAQTLPDALLYLGKVSAATGQDLDFLLESYVRGVGRLSPMILDNLAVQVDLNEAYEVYAAKLGKATEELTKQEQQQAVAEATLAQLATNTAAMPDIVGSAAQQWAAFRTTLADTKDTIGLAFLPVMQTVLQEINLAAQKYLPGFLEAVGKVGTVVNDLVNYFKIVLGEGDFLNDYLAGLPSSIQPFVQGIGEGVAAVLDFVRYIGLVLSDGDYLNDYLANLPTSIRPFAEAVGRLVSEVMPYIQMAWEWITQNVKLGDVLAALGTILAAVIIPAIISFISSAAPVIGAILGIVAAFVGLVAIFAAVRQAWETDWMGIRTTLTEAWESHIWPALQELWNWLSVNVPIAFETLKGFWENTLYPVLQELWTWFQTNLPVAIETLRGYWEGTLYPAIQTVATFIATEIVPRLAELAAWFQSNIPVAVATLQGVWQNVLLPAAQAVADFFVNVVMPVLAILADVFQTVVATAITIVVSAWQNLLYPALVLVWNFIQTSLVPLFQALANVYFALVNKAVELLSALWQNKLYPAILAVIGYIQTNVIPVFHAVHAVVQNTVGPVFQWLGDEVLPAVESALDAIGEAVDWVIEQLNSLAGSISNIQIPDWLQPGSPPPLYYALMDIRDAMREVSGASLGIGGAFGVDVSGTRAGAGGAPLVIAPVVIDGDVVRGPDGETNYDAIADLVMRQVQSLGLA
ncbi:MAG: hypothetical protein JXA14_26115 [Anaerolineae bacterium]|nr:hypothetical protein [Anaerolineae bacterium]